MEWILIILSGIFIMFCNHSSSLPRTDTQQGMGTTYDQRKAGLKKNAIEQGRDNIPDFFK